MTSTTVATNGAEALLKAHRTPDGGLLRTSRDGAAKYAGFLDDYAFLAQACLALRDAGAAGEWQFHANELIEQTLSKFGDTKLGGFYFTEASATDLIVRQKTATDTKPYATTVTEPSPLQRTLNQTGPGTAWYDNNKNIAQSHLLNRATDNLKLWTVDGTGMPVSSACTMTMGQSPAPWCKNARLAE